ncbi:MAG TPA: ferrochelatase [Candidatus Acidoferrales bacterium]|nr:ferrochelatase [Candidatus Acidoferrales bacterium]
MNPRKKIGVVLFQLGGPDSLEAVEGFLYNLFCDPEIINFMGAGLARRPLARWIASRRSKIVRSHYEAIGGKSPILELTNRQAAALAAALEPEFEAQVVVAMRYWHPLTEEAIRALKDSKFEQLVLLPLYPHYSFATTGSSLKEWQRHYRSDGVPVRVVNDFHEHPLYITALVERINEALAKLPAPGEVHLVFSAHGLPMSLVEQGDPYPGQIETTVRLVREAGKWENPHTLCYQSRVGNQKWLEPSLVNTIASLAKGGTLRMLVIPISFVTEHIETLHEINIEAREEAERLGVKDFHVTRALNDSPAFIRALADLVTQAASAAE